jgi:hypothetical protein
LTINQKHWYDLPVLLSILGLTLFLLCFNLEEIRQKPARKNSNLQESFREPPAVGWRRGNVNEWTFEGEPKGGH